MHITSTVTSTKTTHDIPVLLLASSDANGLVHSRKFVPRPSHYHDLVVTARKVFDLKNDAMLVFGTSTLDVCRGAWIEIDKSAYEPLLECLDEVIIRASVPHKNAGGHETDKSPTRETDRVIDANPIFERSSDPTMPERRQPDASTSIVDGSHTFVPSALSRHEETIHAEPTTSTQLSSSPPRPKSRAIPDPEPVHKSTKSRLLTQLDEMSKQKSKPPYNSRQRKPEPEPEPEPERADELEIEEILESRSRPASVARQMKKEPEPKPVLRPEPPTVRQCKPHTEPEPVKEDEPEEEDEGDQGHPSDAITEDTLDARQRDSIEDEEDENFWRFGTTSVGPSSGPSRKQESVFRPTISPTLNPRLTKMGSTKHVEVKKELEEKKKIRDARAGLSAVHAMQLPRASARPLAHFHQDPDQRFMVTVHGPRPGQGADFRTRGGHKIKKVLESACRTFQLPFEHSILVLEDDSKAVAQYYCDPEETLGACGIDTDTRLLVQVDGLTNEELSRYGEEEDED